jgi:Glycine-zipper domain
MKSINFFQKQFYMIPVLAGGLALSALAQAPGTQRQQDENFCHQQSTQGGKHQTLKDAGIGAVGGAVVGKVLHKPGLGAAGGAAAGGIYGHKKSNSASAQAKKASKKYDKCMRDKGYNNM